MKNHTRAERSLATLRRSSNRRGQCRTLTRVTEAESGRTNRVMGKIEQREKLFFASARSNREVDNVEFALRIWAEGLRALLDVSHLHLEPCRRDVLFPEW